MSASGSAGPGSSSQRRGRGWWRGRPYRGGRWRGGRGRGSFSSYGKGDGSGPSSKPTAGAPLVQATLTNSRYPAWHIYMPNEAFSEGSPSARLVSAFMDYFQTHLPHYNLEELDSSGSLPLDCTALLADTALSTAVPDLASMIRNQPEATLNQMALALHTVLSSSLAGEVEITSEGERESRGNGSTDSYLKVPRLHIRLHNFRPIISLKSIKAPQYGKCVTVQGTVVRVSNIKPLVTTMAFKCLLCQEIQAVALSDGKYQLPTKCPTSECRGRTFTPLRSSPLTQTIDWQTVRVQEISGDDRREAGRIPRTIECELTADLVDACVPGDMVTITAVVKATGSEEVGRGRNAKDKCMFLLYLHAISVSNSKASAADASHGLHMDFSTKDYYAIQEIQSDKNVFRLIVGSLCPTIYGHEMVKAGLVLGLFGGSQKFVDSKNNIPIRGDPHILVVGDPGLGKSQMLQAAANVTPRGVYVCGNTTTTSGLTVTLTKEGGGSGNYALEAGALVLADQVFCQEQPTVQSSITCKRGDENVSSAAPISYRKGDQSIIVCKSADPHLELVAGENTRGVVRRSDHNNRILGIWLKDIDSSVRMVSTGGNYDRRLDFVVEPGDPPTSCEMENAPIVPRDDQVQCTLNDEPFGENTIIYLSKECRQSSVVVCTMPYDANIGHFGPGDLSRLKTWSPIKKNSTHFIAILRMEDIPVNTTKDVSMEILDLNIVDTRPSPFTFTVVDQSTDLGGTTTMQMSTITPSDYTSTGTTSEEKEPSVSSGCCCIDEFDKMGSQHQALLEAMEQQSISLAKAGVVCSLPARTSILAAANPVGGHYNRAKTVSENLKMNSALLSRFDLVFILLDSPDEEMDSMLSEHVMALHAQHSGSGSSRDAPSLRNNSRRTQTGVVDSSLDQSHLLLLGEDQASLMDRLKIPRSDPDFDPVPSQLLRKYVGYARKYVHPHLSNEAAAQLQKFYLELRKNRQSQDSTPITTRQLESLIRLTEARARVELREEATEADASDVIEIMKFSMLHTFSDEFGMLDFQRSQNGSGMSQRSQAKRFISELSRIADHTSSSTFTVQQLRDIVKRIGLQVRCFEDFIYSLNNQNYLLKKGPKLYQLQTASCL